MASAALRTLTSLRRLRHIETDEARRDLAEALAKETALAERAEAIDRQVASERAAPNDYDREALAAFLNRMRVERTRLTVALTLAEANTEAARTLLANRRVAETAAEEALAQVVAAQAAEAAHREQIMLEDVARALRSAFADAKPLRLRAGRRREGG
jgi:hypothetical protein